VYLCVQLDLGIQVHLQSLSITASRCISKLALSWPLSASLSYMISACKCISELHDHGLQVHLQTRSIMASKCISEFNLILASKCISEVLNPGLQMHLQTRLITASKCISVFNSIWASKCISKLARSQPPSTSPKFTQLQLPSESPSSLNQQLQVLLQLHCSTVCSQIGRMYIYRKT